MPVLVFLCLDCLFLLLNICLVLVLSFFVLFTFKDQFLFLFCLPYFSKVSGNSLVLTSFESALKLYSLLVTFSFCFLTPILLLFATLYLSFTTFDVLFIYFLCFLFSISSILFLKLTPLFLGTVLPSTLSILSLLTPSHYSLITIVFDITVDSWLRFALIATVLLPFFLIVYFIFVFMVCYTNSIGVFFVRLGLVFILFSVVIVFLPYEPLLHFIVLTSLLVLIELPFLLRFIGSSYLGRVA